MAHKNAPTPSVRAKSPIARASSNERSRSPLYSPGIDSPGIEARVQQLEEDDAGRQGISSPVWRSTLQRNVSSGIEIAEHMEDRLEAILHHPKTQRQPCNCFGVLGETCPVCEKETLQAVEQPPQMLVELRWVPRVRASVRAPAQAQALEPVPAPPPVPQ